MNAGPDVLQRLAGLEAGQSETNRRLDSMERKLDKLNGVH